MSSMQIVFLFDLNAFNDDRTKSNEELQAKLMCLRLACLRILTHYSNAIPNLKWGFKFFDSLGSLTQTMCNFSFINVSLENFETLENEICSRYHRHIAYQEALALSVQDQSIDEEISFSKEAPIRLLHLALTQILCEYHWNDSIDMFSPSIRKSIHKHGNKRNFLFLISKCASSSIEFQKYFGVEYSSVKASKLSKLLLSQSLQEQLLHKASISWIWLNTSESGSFLKNSFPDILTMIAESLRSLQCALVPLSVFSVPNYILKLENSFKKQESEISNLGISYNCLIPFSASVFQSFMYPFYLSRKEISVEAKLCFLENDLQVPIIVTKVPLHWNEKEYKLYHDRSLHQTTHTRYLNEKIVKLNIPNSWKKFTVHFTIARHVQLKPCNILLCMSNVSIKSSNYCWLQLLIKSLFLKNVNLFVVCESSCGLTFPGIFTSLSETSSVISILNPNACFINETNPVFVTSKSPNDFNISDVKHSLEIESDNFKLNIDNSKKNFDDMNEKQNHLKPFQMESMETWFMPSSQIYKAVSEVLDHLSCVSNVEAFHKKLQLSTLNKKSKEKKLTNISKEVTKPKVHENESNDLEDYDQTCKNISYDQLISLLNETYTITLNSNGSALHAAKKIVRIASSFFLKQSIIKYEENTKNFMSEYFYTNYRNLVEKYGADQNENAAINECKLQAGLILEMELLFPSSEESNCVKSITSFLGIMSFYSGATSLVKFIQEDLLGSYGHKLYNLLVEIADELCISLNKDDDSSEGSNSEASPISMNENISSLSSSALSYKSSASSKSDGRKLIRKRSDISISSKKRQILLPHKSPKKKKTRHSFASENIPIRYSPRLATKKKKEKLSKSAENDPKNVRRNLFSRDKKPQTPRTNRFYSGSPFKKKKIITTPKSHHVLKTNFVPNTPSHKQNQSALQRRKSQIDVCSEIAESPTVSRNAKDKNKLLMLQELKEKSLPSTSYAQPGSGSKSMPNSSVTQYTPESKRRLSLKLFSKLLASPTARMGIKKCSKRLFDQVTPHSPTTPSKRIKHDEQYESTNKGKNQNISSQEKKSQ